MHSLSSRHADLFHEDFVNEPYWWQMYRPTSGELVDVSKKTTVAIIGGGYAGLSTALELSKQGIDCVVFEANTLGFGASTRNAGGLSGGVNIGRRLGGGSIKYAPGEREALFNDAARSFTYIKNFIEKENIQCQWNLAGRFVGAWTPKHYRQQEKRTEYLNKYAHSGAYMVPKEEQHKIIDTNLYYGGQVIQQSATINPALYYKALLDLCQSQESIIICAQNKVLSVAGTTGHWKLHTERGNIQAKKVVLATNGYTENLIPELKKSIIPIESHTIVTEALDKELAQSIMPANMLINDTLRVRSYYRLTPDGQRILYGGRGRFTRTDYIGHSRALYQLMVERLPQLKGTKISFAWSGYLGFTFDSIPHIGQKDGIYYVLGCNGSGVAMMSFLGNQLAQKIAGLPAYECHYDRPIPEHQLYQGKPWFLGPVGGVFKVLDKFDRFLARWQS